MPLDKKTDQEDTDHHEAKGASSDESHELNSSGEGEVFRKRQRLRSPSPGLSPRGTPQASPPRFASMEEIMAAASGVGNMVLAHEIAVDNNFTLKPVEPPESSLEKQIKDIVHKAFWDSLQEGLNDDPPNFDQAVNLLGEVKQELSSLLLPAHTKIRTEINETLDLELIKQQAEHDSIDVFKYANFVMSIMAKLCAPARDDEIKKLGEITDVVQLFKEIFRIIDLMKLDMANFTIQSMRPHIQQHSIEYERKKFKEFLKTQEEQDGLEFTKQWLKTAADTLVSLQEAFRSRSPSPSASSSNTVNDGASASAAVATAPAAVMLNQGYMNLLQWDDSQLFPETLLMDQGRFLDLRDKVNRLVLVSSVLLMTYSVVGAAISGIKGFVDKLKNVINVLLEGESELDEVMINISEQICKEVNECLTEHSFPAMTESKESSLKKHVQDMKDPEHNVRKLLGSRAKEFIRFVISATSAFDPKKKIPAGLEPVHQELIDLSGQFLRLVIHNRAVFAPFYADIIKEIKEKATSKTENSSTEEKVESRE
ncbi:T-complex protein 11-like protein 1 [Ptychodera flava]|uniref:T-complex protein 11-like protein 1 n=1 Tax=Ptychodera flava TaxID=63121 RepID=UPI003969E35B